MATPSNSDPGWVGRAGHSKPEIFTDGREHNSFFAVGLGTGVKVLQ